MMALFLLPALASAGADNNSANRFYLFSRLMVPAAAYSTELVPLFDETNSFSKLEAYLKERKVSYFVSHVCMALTDFPEPLQQQLIKFEINDNVIINGKDRVAILKIKGWYTRMAVCQRARPRRR